MRFGKNVPSEVEFIVAVAQFVARPDVGLIDCGLEDGGQNKRRQHRHEESLLVLEKD